MKSLLSTFTTLASAREKGEVRVRAGATDTSILSFSRETKRKGIGPA